MRQAPNATNYQFRLILPYFFIIILDVMSIWIVLPVLAPLVNTSANILGHHLSDANKHLMYGVILSITGFCLIFAAPLLGYLSDRIGRKKVLIYCACGAFVSFMIYSFSFSLNSLILLLIARLVNGVSSGSLVVAQSAMADISHGEQRAINIAFIAVAMTLGLLFGPLLGGVLSDKTLISWFNNALPFYAGAVLSFICIMMMFYFLKETSVHRLKQENNYHFAYGMKQLLKNHYVIFVLLSFFFFELAWNLYVQSIPLFLTKQLHYSNAMLGFFLNGVMLVMSIGLLVILRISLKFMTLHKIILLGLLINIVAYLAAYFFAGHTGQWLAGILIALAVATCYPALKAAASNAFLQQAQGFIMGVSYAILCFAFAISGILSGYLNYKNVKLPFQASVVFCCIGFIIFVIVMFNRKNSLEK
ncbi:MAG: MFS transporter [Pseudomonadota bacterium]